MANSIILHGLPTPDSEDQEFKLTSVPKSENSPTHSPLPCVSKLDSNAFTSRHELLAAIVESMRISGGCIVQNLVCESILKDLEREIRPHLDAVKKADGSRDEFVPSATKTVTGLLSKSQSYALNIVGNDLFQDVSSHFLTSTLENSWHGNQARTSVSKPQLSTTITFSVPPGTPAQSLHRDDDIYHTWQSEAATHHLGRDTMVCFFVAGSKCTKQNGATRIVPGSHLWNFSCPPPEDESMFFQAEMQPGDAFFMLGGTYHSASENKTTDEERLIHAAFATRGYLRQEENQYLANDLDKIRKLPASIQRFAGFGVSKPFMGWVDLEDPIVKVLGGECDPEADFW